MSDDEWRAGAAKKGFGVRDGRQTPGDRFRKAFDKADDRKRQQTSDRRNGAKDNFRDRDAKEKRSGGRRFADSPYPFRKKENNGLQIEGKTPSLPPSDGPIMRERRAGWKTRPDFTKKNDTTDNND